MGTCGLARIVAASAGFRLAVLVVSGLCIVLVLSPLDAFAGIFSDEFELLQLMRYRAADKRNKFFIKC